LVVVSSHENKTGDTYRLAFWDIEAGREHHVPLELPPEEKFYHSIAQMKFSPDAHWLAAVVHREGGRRKNEQGEEVWITADRVYLVNMVTATVSGCIEPENHSISSLAFSADSARLATVQSKRTDRHRGERLEARRSGDARIWDVATGNLLKTLGHDAGQMPSDVAFTPDDKSLAVSYWATGPEQQHADHPINIWSWPELKLETTLHQRSGAEFPAGSRWLLAHGTGGKLLLRDLQSGEDRDLLAFDSARKWPRRANVAADGRSMLCLFNDGRIVRLDFPTGKPLAEAQATVRNPRYWFNSYALTRDSRLFAITECSEPKGRMTEDWEEVPPSEIHVWDAVRLRRLDTLTGHVGGIYDVEFSADDYWLFSTGTDGTIRRWDLSDLVR
jgi:WD40 repeat protein